MTRILPPKRWQGDWAKVQETHRATTTEVHQTNPETRTLLGPKGEVLRTFSNRPPTGFHQGTREPA